MLSTMLVPTGPRARGIVGESGAGHEGDGTNSDSASMEQTISRVYAKIRLAYAS